MANDFYNIIEYVRNETARFQEKPLNNADVLVFSAFSYAKIESVLDGDGVDRISSKYTMKDFWRNEYIDEEFNDGISDDENEKLMSAIASSRRFRNIRVKNLVSKLSNEIGEQFAAVGFELDTNTDYVCFRGTDGSLTGWREDFALSFMEEVPAQRSAVDYIDKFYGNFSSGRNKRLYIGGHSKGGNLSAYAGAFCKESIKKRIIKVFIQDGPGFRTDVAEEILKSYKKSNISIEKFVPQSSIIGMLLTSGLEKKIIYSNAKGGINQHNLFTWEIINGDLVYLEDMTRTGIVMDRTVREWLEKADDNQRKKFTDAIFDSLMNNGIETLNDIRDITAEGFSKIMNTYKDMDEDTKAAVTKMMANLAKASLEHVFL